MLATQEKSIKDKIFFLVLLAVVLLVLSLIFFFVFVHNINSIDEQYVQKAIVYQWACLLSALLGIALIGFAILLKMVPMWDIEVDTEDEQED